MVPHVEKSKDDPGDQGDTFGLFHHALTASPWHNSRVRFWDPAEPD